MHVYTSIKSLQRENKGVLRLHQSQILSHAKLAKNAIFHVIYSSGAGGEPFFLIVLPYPPLRFLDPNDYKEVCAQSQSQVNVGASAGSSSQSQVNIGLGPRPSSQDGVSQLQEPL